MECGAVDSSQPSCSCRCLRRDLWHSLFSHTVGRSGPDAASGEGRTNDGYGPIGTILVQVQTSIREWNAHERRRVTFPEDVFYSWPHPSRKFIYVGWSANLNGKVHGLTTLRVDPKTGALEKLQTISLPARMTYVTLNVPSRSHVHLISPTSKPSRRVSHEPRWHRWKS